MVKIGKALLFSFFCLTAFASPSFAEDKMPAKGLTMSFKDVDIDVLIKQFSDYTKRNYILDEKVKGKISIHLPGGVSTENAVRILDAMLQLKGFTSVPVGNNIWKIIPSKDAKQTTIPTIDEIDGRGAPTVVTHLINLKYVSSDDVKQLLTPLISSYGLMNAYTGTNTILLIDAEENIQRLLKIINSIDVPFSNREMIIIPVKHAAATDIANTIKELLTEDGDSKGNSNNDKNLDFVRARMNARQNRMPGEPSENNSVTVGAARSRAPKILADERTNSIIVVADEDMAARIRALVAELDSSVDLAGMDFYVYHCVHADAEQLADVLSNLAGSGGGTSSSSSSSTGSSFSRNNNNNRNSRSTSNSKYKFGGSSSSSSSSSNSNTGTKSASSSTVSFGEDLTITSDPTTNSLVIHSTKKDYKRLLKLIKELDVKRRQVLVEALLLDVKISDSESFSAGFMSSGGGDDGGVIGINNGSDLATLFQNPTGLSQFTLAAASAGSLTLGGVGTFPTQTLLIQAASKNNNINVLSAPTILATDNEEAEIVVGENVPFITSNSANSDISTTYRQIDREDVGITLRLTPQISSRDYVTLSVFTEVSNVTSTDTELGPTTAVKTSQTTIIAKDSQMIVIGGLIGENYDETESGVPYLRNIPILGHLFRNSSMTREKRNLLIFITPRIIKDQYDLRDSTITKRDKMNDFIEWHEVQPSRRDILDSDDVDHVTESHMYEGEKPTTITAPEKEPVEVNTEDKPIKVTINPSAPAAKVAADTNAKYIVLQAMRGERPAGLPFTINDASITGIVVPAESNIKAKSFFEMGATYKYSLKDEDVPFQVMAVFSNKADAEAMYGNTGWYTLSPFELIKIGRMPWQRFNN